MMVCTVADTLVDDNRMLILADLTHFGQVMLSEDLKGHIRSRNSKISEYLDDCERRILDAG